ncbi:hypothetical protein Fmac_015915 [Flemingia macrophylla]|uniref:Leucine-rich repeat-containing N-terminal plant-type domain-containing protein n=1 Tax=Flemingia macrophylla TaxID=520843 RepID=A0ABD1MG01_9FABA
MFAFGVSRETRVCIPSERETLLKLKHHLIDPSNRLSSWNNASANSNCCHWAGVLCNNLTAHVVQLHLNTTPPHSDDFQLDDEGYDEAYHEAYEAYERSQLGGELNPCLADLKHLNYLDLSSNVGLGEGKSIPAFLGAMTSLTHLDLSYTGFYGKIPSQIGNLSNLVYLNLSSMVIYETIPSQMGNLSNLRYLGLGENDLFVENVDWLSRLSKLEYLDLRHAYLSKAFHWLHTLQTLPSLTNLSLSGCTLPLPHHSQPSALNFSSLLSLGMSYVGYPFVPKWIFGLTKLVSLDLSANYIEGPIPYDFQNLTLLQTLDLSFNSFSSSIPDSIYGLRQLKFLRLDGNNLNGSISNALGNLTFLIELDLSHNYHLEGTIPTSLERLTSLVRLDLSDNQFIGNPFESLKSLYKLSHLYITINHFQGVVKEDHLANLTSLKSFYASGNNFTLKVGPDWYPRFQLTNLNMRSWKLGPKFSSWIQSQKNLQYLDMSNTWISDSIPTWFWEALPHASYVNLSHNHIHGKLMTTLRNPLSINVVDLSKNHLCGKLPYLSKDVYWLDISSNSFSETMDDFLCQKPDKLMQLEFLNLASNKLSGRIPDCWINWNNSVVDLDFAHNSLSGNIPSCFSHLNAMLEQNKSNDLFICLIQQSPIDTAIIVGQIQVDSAISVFLWTKGRDTEYKSILGLVTNIDLSNNNLSGTIPREITDLDGLIYLNLSHNQLSGEIPPSIGNMRLLESIDISRNQISGEIPSTISNLSFLSSLDMSHNHLKGKIPTGTQIQSFETSDFAGNNLCGPPLPTNCDSNQKVLVTDNIGAEIDGHEVNWFFVSMAIGFVVGFWTIIASLLIYRSWRFAYFSFPDEMLYKLKSY